MKCHARDALRKVFETRVSVRLSPGGLFATSPLLVQFLVITTKGVRTRVTENTPSLLNEKSPHEALKQGIFLPETQIGQHLPCGVKQPTWRNVSCNYESRRPSSRISRVNVVFDAYCTKMTRFGHLFAAYCAGYSAFIAPNQTYTDVYCANPYRTTHSRDRINPAAICVFPGHTRGLRSPILPLASL